MQDGGVSRTSSLQWSTSSTHLLVERQESQSPSTPPPWRRHARERHRTPRSHLAPRGPAAKSEPKAAAKAWVRRRADPGHLSRKLAAKARACAREARGTAIGGTGLDEPARSAPASGSRDAQGRAQRFKPDGTRISRRAHQRNKHAIGSRVAQEQEQARGKKPRKLVSNEDTQAMPMPVPSREQKGQARGSKPRKLVPQEDRPEQTHGTKAKSMPAPTPTRERKAVLKLAEYLLRLPGGPVTRRTSLGQTMGCRPPVLAPLRNPQPSWLLPIGRSNPTATTRTPMLNQGGRLFPSPSQDKVCRPSPSPLYCDGRRNGTPHRRLQLQQQKMVPLVLMMGSLALGLAAHRCPKPRSMPSPMKIVTTRLLRTVKALSALWRWIAKTFEACGTEWVETPDEAVARLLIRDSSPATFVRGASGLAQHEVVSTQGKRSWKKFEAVETQWVDSHDAVFAGDSDSFGLPSFAKLLSRFTEWIEDGVSL